MHLEVFESCENLSSKFRFHFKIFNIENADPKTTFVEGLSVD